MATKTSLTPQARAEQRARAQATRMLLDDTAAMINAHNATALRIVMDAFAANVHTNADGFSAHLDWLRSQFDFPHQTASSIVSVAKLAKKFTVLAEAALSGYARIDQVAYAMNRLNTTAAAALFARTPFREAVPSPWDSDTLCATPEALVTEYAAHAPFKVLERHLRELHANLAEEAELLDSLGEESLQRFELQEISEGGMWVVSGLLSATTGMLLNKYLKTAVPPPRKDETDADGVLPPQATRNAEAVHQLVAGYGSSPEAVTRHGHTATLDLVVDIETLQGKDTGRTPLLEGRPTSLARARLLACEGVIIPSVFNYATGEAIELGRALRLPNTALRRKLELEQPEGCAWHGCDRPIAWTEAHHLRHWADGGATTAENLILLCRFHHGRIHTAGWSVTKTGPGQAVIVHHDHPTTDATGTAACEGATGQDITDPAKHGAGERGTGEAGCGCADWRTDTDMDASFTDDAKNFFPTGLYPHEWSEAMTPDLEAVAAQVKEAKAYYAFGGSAAEFDTRGLGGTPDDTDEADAARTYRTPVTDPPPIYGEGRSSEDLIPFLRSPPGRQSRRGRTAAPKAQVGHRATTAAAQACALHGSRPFPMHRKEDERPTPDSRPRP